MGALKNFSSKELIGLLKSEGFVEVRQRGSHIVLQKRVTETTFTVIVPNHREIKIGTLKSIIRQSNLDQSIFELKKS